jgi:hypothetical protein
LVGDLPTSVLLIITARRTIAIIKTKIVTPWTIALIVDEHAHPTNRAYA